MNILVACEFSGLVRDAFIRAGHNAISCDLEPSEKPGPHLQHDVLDILALNLPWDMMIAFPPCTYLAASGARWWKNRQFEQEAALEFVRKLMVAPIERIAIENPVGRISTVFGLPNQIIHPYMFGHGETKKTCLWLKNLPLLRPTDVVEGRESRIHRMPDTKHRKKNRSRTYTGVAAAMAKQWGCVHPIMDNVEPLTTEYIENLLSLGKPMLDKWIPRWLIRLDAFLFGFFWLPCPVCLRPFSGREWKTDNTIYPGGGCNGFGVCSSACRNYYNTINLAMIAMQKER